MKRQLAFALFTSFISLKTASASRNSLYQRDICETLYCTPDLWGTAGAFFDEYILPYLQPDRDQSPTKTPSQKTDIEINVIATPSNEEECSTNAPTAFNSQSDHGNPVPGSCLQTSQVTIWPNDCGDEIQNTETARILAEMDPTYLTSINPMCAVKDGVLFWLAMLTKEQIQSLKDINTAVKEVIPNLPCKSDEAVITSPAEMGSNLGLKRSHLKKREDTAKVANQQRAHAHLAFLSTAPQKQYVPSYAYLDNANDEFQVTVYIIGSGASPSLEFGPGQIADWLFALDISSEKTDGSVRGETPGTCSASIIGGIQTGVAKRAKLIIVKTGNTIASLLDAVGKVVLDIQTRFPIQHPKGSTVVSISKSFENRPDYNSYVLQLHYLITVLAGKFQVVVVTSAGKNALAALGLPHSTINTWPALYADVDEIVTVGSVAAAGQDWGAGRSYGNLQDGQRFSWSQGGPLLTVNAPGNALCADRIGNGYIYAEGPGVSLAVATGLIAYFLAQRDLHRWFVRQRRTIKAVIDYLQMMSYSRFGQDKSVWNGLDATSGAQSLPSPWYGTPPPTDGQPWNWPPDI